MDGMSPTGASPVLRSLLAAGLFFENGADGMYGRSGAFESVALAVEALARRVAAADGAEVMRFPPALPPATFERTGYLRNFPHLAGVVRCFCGDERAHRDLLRRCDAGEDWPASLDGTAMMLTPAACYPVYPVLARRGAVPEAGWLVDVCGTCFRHEPSRDATRLQWFRMQEFIRVGTEAQVLEFRAQWMARAQALARTLRLPHAVEVANDPFFGRVGALRADAQREQELKFELLVPINPDAPPTACASFNFHGAHFGQNWGLLLDADRPASTSCVGFGLERLAVALFHHHGTDAAAWPDEVRDALWPAR